MDRVEALLDSLSLEEKVAQLTSTWMIPPGMRNEDPEQYLASLEEAFPHGFGSVETMLDKGSLDHEASARNIDLMQHFLRERTRPGIAALVHVEALNGVVYGTALQFPTAIGLAATWKPDSVRRMAAISARQMRALGMHHAFSPVLDVARDGRFGRVHESYGEDPVLCAVLGVAFVRGLQDGPNGVLATGKHFLGYMHSEAALNKATTHLGMRELIEVYALPFEAAIREAGLASIMNSYCAVDGVPVAASRELLTGLLRDRLGFDGLVVSDYGAVAELHTLHHVSSSPMDSAIQAVTAGLDVELPTGVGFPELVEAVRVGRLDEAVVDTAVRRVLRAKARLGLLDRDAEPAAPIPPFAATADEVELSVQMARDSIVLLQNDGSLLPLGPDHSRIAVIGPFADSLRPMFAAYSAPAGAEMLRAMLAQRGTTMAGAESGASGEASGASADVSAADQRAADAAATEADILDRYPDMVTIAAALASHAPPATEFRIVRGVEHLDPDTSGIEAAVAAARWAAAVVCVIGEKTGWAGDATSGEGRDRATLNLTGKQLELVQAIVDTGTPTAVVLLLGRPLDLTMLATAAPALICAFHPGPGGAQAIAEVVWGSTNPGGKLPFSFPRGVGHVPVYASHRVGSGYASEPGVVTKHGYIDDQVGPLFAFGHGLSYTTFALDDIDVDSGSMPTQDGSVVLSCTITNTGSVAGDEVVQLYLRDLVASVARPVRQLGGFLRVSLRPGARKRVSFVIAAAQFALLGHDYRFRIEPGTVEMTVTTGSDLPGLTTRVELTGDPQLLPHRTTFYSAAYVVDA